jgi:hypothetical protein
MLYTKLKLVTRISTRNMYLYSPSGVIKKYNTIEDSFKDFVKFLKTNPRYKNAGVFNSNDYAEQIINIARAGYAENKNYAVVITSVANSVAKAIKNQIIKPLQNNKTIIGGLIAFFFLLLYNKKFK